MPTHREVDRIPEWMIKYRDSRKFTRRAPLNTRPAWVEWLIDFLFPLKNQ